MLALSNLSSYLSETAAHPLPAGRGRPHSPDLELVDSFDSGIACVLSSHLPLAAAAGGVSWDSALALECMHFQDNLHENSAGTNYGWSGQRVLAGSHIQACVMRVKQC